MIFFYGGLTLYIQNFQGAKFSLFSYNLAFICMKHRSVLGGGGGKGEGAYLGITSAFGGT